MLTWRAFENGEPMLVFAPDDRLRPFGLRETVRMMVQAREGFAPEQGKLSWEVLEDNVHELYWLPYDHGPAVNLHIKVVQEYDAGIAENQVHPSDVASV